MFYRMCVTRVKVRPGLHFQMEASEVKRPVGYVATVRLASDLLRFQQARPNMHRVVSRYIQRERDDDYRCRLVSSLNGARSYLPINFYGTRILDRDGCYRQFTYHVVHRTVRDPIVAMVIFEPKIDRRVVGGNASRELVIILTRDEVPSGLLERVMFCRGRCYRGSSCGGDGPVTNFRSVPPFAVSLYGIYVS